MSPPQSSSRPPGRLAIAAANTVYAVRGQIHDSVDSPSRLQEWLHRHADPLTLAPTRRLTAADVTAFRTLRDALRSLLNSVAAGEPGDPGAVLTLNGSAARAPGYRTLSILDGGFTVAQRFSGRPAGIAIALATVADDAIALLGSGQAGLARLCAAPNCVQFFLDDNHARRWCSPACGNRARAARHYRRHAAGRPS